MFADLVICSISPRVTRARPARSVTFTPIWRLMPASSLHGGLQA